jgi:hypothetical protein
MRATKSQLFRENFTANIHSIRKNEELDVGVVWKQARQEVRQHWFID